jgi:hypothetical protein
VPSVDSLARGRRSRGHVRGFFAVTDLGWYQRLAALGADRGPMEANFWRPSSRRVLLPAGTPFLFKLRAPANAIAGFGYFASFSVLPDWLGDISGGADSAARARRGCRSTSRAYPLRRREGAMSTPPRIVAERLADSRCTWDPGGASRRRRFCTDRGDHADWGTIPLSSGLRSP